MDNSTDNTRRRVNPVVLIAILIEIIMIVVMILVFVNFKKSEAENSVIESVKHNVEIKNLNFAVPNLTKNSTKNLMFAINDIVWLNNEKVPENIVGSIRTETVDSQYFKESNTYVVKFTVDLTDLKQSYKVAHVYMKQNSYELNIPANQRLIIYCPSKDEMIYENQECRDRYAGTAEDVINKWDFTSSL